MASVLYFVAIPKTDMHLVYTFYIFYKLGQIIHLNLIKYFLDSRSFKIMLLLEVQNGTGEKVNNQHE